MKNCSAWSRSWSRLFLPGAGADPSKLEPESAPGPWPSGAGAAQKGGGSATLNFFQFLVDKFTLLDPDPDPGGKMNADPCGSGSTALAQTPLQRCLATSVPFRKMGKEE